MDGIHREGLPPHASHAGGQGQGDTRTVYTKRP